MRDIEGRIKINKLDGRYNGHGVFRYFVTTESRPSMPFNYRSWIIMDHLTLREWCWHQWGPSCEWDMYQIMRSKECNNQNWCWDSDQYKLRILLADDLQAGVLSLAFAVA